MFTGIIESVGVIKSINESNGGKVFGVRAPFKPLMGESISVNGVCVTVSGLFKEGFFFFASPETLSRTTFSTIKEGKNVNLERALKVGDRFGGHIVTGHIDGVAQVLSSSQNGEVVILKIKIPEELRSYVIPKGSIAIDGVSLTINEVEEDIISLSIIPFTLKATQLGKVSPGDKVNVEVDIISKTVFKAVENILSKNNNINLKKGGVTMDLLEKAGFIGNDR